MFFAFVAVVMVVVCLLVKADPSVIACSRTSLDMAEMAVNFNESLTLSNGSQPITKLVQYAMNNKEHYSTNCNAFRGLIAAATAHPTVPENIECSSSTNTLVTGEYLTFKRDELDTLMNSAHGKRYLRIVQAQMKALKWTNKDSTISEEFSNIYGDGTESFEVGHVLMKAFYDSSTTNWHVLILTAALRGQLDDAKCSYDQSFRDMLFDASRSVQDYLLSLTAMSPDVVGAYMDFAKSEAQHAQSHNSVAALPELGDLAPEQKDYLH